jgi:hypothetical protein
MNFISWGGGFKASTVDVPHIVMQIILYHISLYLSVQRYCSYRLGYHGTKNIVTSIKLIKISAAIFDISYLPL